MTDSTTSKTTNNVGQAAPAKAKRSQLTVAFAAGGLAIGMLGMAYAAVPLYQMFCQVTGFAGTTKRAEAPSQTVTAKTVSIRFDSNVANGLGWEFKPVQRTMDVKVGENALAFYEATNTTDETLVGTATFNVAPDAAGYYFNKMECFCFTEQTLKPGETVEMPVSFFVDPDFNKDKESRQISQITLSYTFYPMDKSTDTGQETDNDKPRS